MFLNWQPLLQPHLDGGGGGGGGAARQENLLLYIWGYQPPASRHSYGQVVKCIAAKLTAYLDKQKTNPENHSLVKQFQTIPSLTVVV